MIMKTPETYGYEEVRYPITHARLSRIEGKWLVQYRRKSRWWIDGFFWFTDSVHTRFVDAEYRTNMLTNDKYYTRLEPIKRVIHIDQ